MENVIRFLITMFTETFKIMLCWIYFQSLIEDNEQNFRSGIFCIHFLIKRIYLLIGQYFVFNLNKPNQAI